MKQYNKLVVCGCSVSDRTKVRYAYGDYLAASLGIDYLHLAGGAGSDKRNIRLLVQAIQQGEVDSNTLVLFQPAEVIRREIPSHISEEYYEQHVAGVNEKNENHLGATPVYDKTITGQIVARFKLDSCHWQSNETDRAMQLAYQENPGCLNSTYDSEMLSVYWYMLEGLCKSKGISLVVVEDCERGWPSLIFHNYGDVIKEEYYNKDNWVNMDTFIPHQERNTIYALDPPRDITHFNQAGHIFVADELEKLLRQKGIL
jgi:hypothetical protein